MSNQALVTREWSTRGHQLRTTARALAESVAGPSVPLAFNREPMDEAQESSAQYTAEALRQMRVEQCDLVNRALARMAQGAYGSCEDCGDAIDAERLRMLPEATRCVACQQRQDAVR